MSSTTSSLISYSSSSLSTSSSSTESPQTEEKIGPTMFLVLEQTEGDLKEFNATNTKNITVIKKTESPSVVRNTANIIYNTSVGVFEGATNGLKALGNVLWNAGKTIVNNVSSRNQIQSKK